MAAVTTYHGARSATAAKVGPHRQEHYERHRAKDAGVPEVPGPPEHPAIPHDGAGIIRTGVQGPPAPIAGVAPQFLGAPSSAAG